MWRCENKAHARTSLSLFTNTILQHFQIPVSTFLKTLFFIAQGQNLDEIVLNVKVSRKTAVRVHKMVRDLICNYNRLFKKRIGGQGMVVEIDECHIHSRKNGVGRIEEGDLWWVVGGICRQTSEMFAVVTKYRDRQSLSKIIFENVNSKSTIYTDCWRGYNKLEEMNLDYVHKTVNHSYNFVDPVDRDVYTNTVERSWRSLRDNLPYGVGLKEVESYIQKFLFFHDRHCKSSIDRFNAMISLCNHFYPLN